MTDLGNIIILSAPSGTGKSTLLKRVMEADPNLSFSISHTTRAPRAGEAQGREYHFVDRPQFERMVAEDAFLEWAEFSGNLYGTSRQEIHHKQREGMDIILDIEIEGARQVMEKLPGGIAIFVLPPNFKTLEKRLRGRGTDSEDAIQRRLARAREEVHHCGTFEFLLVNDNLEICAREMSSIIHGARCRFSNRRVRAENILSGFK